MEKFLNNRLWVGDFTRFQAIEGGAFNHLNCQHTRKFNQIYASDSARKLWETLRRPSQNLAIWTAQRILFYPMRTFVFFYIYFIAKFLAPSELKLKKRSP